jgi:hypothetical protein
VRNKINVLITEAMVGAEYQGDIPMQYNLQQNYPNPFSNLSSIVFSLPEAGDVKIEISDIKGKRIAILLNDYRLAGNHKLIFDGSQLKKGFYFYKIQAGTYIQMRKMILMK